jgi:hypothetical protein
MLYYFVVYFQDYNTGEYKKVYGDKVASTQEAEKLAKDLILEKDCDSEWTLFDWYIITFVG